MKVLLYMAMSLDGVIASENGDEDFLSDINWSTFSEFVSEHQAFCVGRKTAETVSKWPDFNFEDFPDAIRIVLSRNTKLPLPHGFIQAHSPQAAIEIADRAGRSVLIVTGGAETNTAFLSAGLVDQIVLNIEPVIIGSGKRVFGYDKLAARLALESTERLKDGVLQVRYRVVR